MKAHSILARAAEAYALTNPSFFQDRLSRRAIRVGECLEWVGARSAGYGTTSVKMPDGKHIQVAAHRLAFVLFFQRGIGELCVCHCCDNPACVNPLHLFLGTDRDNCRDMWAKGRSGVQVRPPKDRPEHHRRPIKQRHPTQGFASLSPDRRREIASKGGRSVKNSNRAFSRNRELASTVAKELWK